MHRARALDALSLGVAVRRLRLEMFLTAALTGVLVSACGAVSFIGLIIPHVARWIAEAEMGRVAPVVGLIGAIFAQVAFSV